MDSRATPSPGAVPASLTKYSLPRAKNQARFETFWKLFSNLFHIKRFERTGKKNDSSDVRLQILATGGILYRKHPQGYLYSFERMVFQQTGKQDNAGRFESGYLKATTENLTNWDLPGCEKPPKTNE